MFTIATREGKKFYHLCVCVLKISPVMWPRRYKKKGRGRHPRAFNEALSNYQTFPHLWIAAVVWGRPARFRRFKPHFLHSGSLWGPGTMKALVRMSPLALSLFAVNVALKVQISLS